MSEGTADPAPRVEGIDSLRALAALAVFACHISQYWLTPTWRLPGKLPEVVSNGAHGVDLFVVISGFCLGMPTARRSWTVHARPFYARRASRLLPPYLAALAFAAGIALSGGYWRVVAARASATDVLAHVALVQTWFPSTLGSINGSFWSIALEAHLYLVFPLLLWCWRRWGGSRVVVLAAAISLAWSGLETLRIGALGSEFLVPARLVEFVVGMWCAEAVCRRRVPPRVALWCTVVLGTSAGLVLSSTDVRYGVSVVWALPCAAAVLLVAGAIGHTGRLRRPLTWFGGVSYSFYLVHQPVLLLTASTGRRLAGSPLGAFALAASVGLALALVVSLPLHVLVERPAQRLGRRSVRNAVQPAVA